MSTISSAKNENFVTKKGCDQGHVTYFLILVPLSKFSMDEARHFFFSLLDNQLVVLQNGWREIQRGVVSVTWRTF